MIELLIDKEIHKFCILDENFNLVDVSDRLKKEIHLHKIFSEHCSEEFIINKEYTKGVCPEIYDLIVEKTYLSFNNANAKYFVEQFNHIVEYNLLTALNKQFKTWCEMSLNKSIDKINYM